MNRRLGLPSLALIALLFTSCSIFHPATIDAGSDPIIVHAERTAGYALDTFDSFLLWEYQNRALLNNQAVKSAADNIRAHGKTWITELRAATQTYKVVKSQPNAEKLDIALGVVNQALETARRYLLIKSAQPSG